MAGCLSALLIWAGATATLFWIGSGAAAEATAAVIAAGVFACLAAQSIVWALTRARHRKVATDYARLFGPLPDDAGARGTRIGGTAGRLLGGSTGYLVGGLVGAAVDLRAEVKKYKGMSEQQVALLHELGRLQLVRPLLTSVLMLGALLASWVLLIVFEMGRTILGF
jgi:hypothetical protein